MLPISLLFICPNSPSFLCCYWCYCYCYWCYSGHVIRLQKAASSRTSKPITLFICPCFDQPAQPQTDHPNLKLHRPRSHLNISIQMLKNLCLVCTGLAHIGQNIPLDIIVLPLNYFSETFSTWPWAGPWCPRSPGAWPPTASSPCWPSPLPSPSSFLEELLLLRSLDL